MSIPGELIPRAGVWLDPGITLCAKTPALAPDVEISQSNCISESQIMLHTRGSMPFWRIVFSTFRGCMSFYTARVKSVVVSQVHASFYFRFAPETGRKFKAWRPRQRGDFTDACTVPPAAQVPAIHAARRCSCEVRDPAIWPVEGNSRRCHIATRQFLFGASHGRTRQPPSRIF